MPCLLYSHCLIELIWEVIDHVDQSFESPMCLFPPVEFKMFVWPPRQVQNSCALVFTKQRKKKKIEKLCQKKICVKIKGLGARRPLRIHILPKGRVQEKNIEIMTPTLQIVTPLREICVPLF